MWRPVALASDFWAAAQGAAVAAEYVAAAFWGAGHALAAATEAGRLDPAEYQGTWSRNQLTRLELGGAAAATQFLARVMRLRATRREGALQDPWEAVIDRETPESTTGHDLSAEEAEEGTADDGPEEAEASAEETGAAAPSGVAAPATAA